MLIPIERTKSVAWVLVINFMFFSVAGLSAYSEEQEALPHFESMVVTNAQKCRDEVVQQFETLLKTNVLTLSKLFDTFYIPIPTPSTSPQKFSTQYDKHLDENIRIILDKYLEKNDRFIFVVAVDINGYVPTHNSRYSKPLTGNPEIDVLHNRTKRLFDDQTGIRAAKNKKPYLIQYYDRDTGEKMLDVSVPIFISDKHWGAIRIGCKMNSS